MLPRVYSPETVKVYLKRIKQAQTSELNLNSILDQETRALISTHREALCCSAELILFPLLTAVAGCMGADASIVVDKAKGWTERPILWICVAGRRGDKKSPALSRIKEAVIGLEKEMCALHKAQNISITGDKETATRPRLLIDEENLLTVGETLKNIETRENKVSLIGMFDSFGTFLRGVGTMKDSPFLDPQNLLKLYNPSDISSQTENSKSFHHSIHFNFIGMITAVDAAGLLDMFDADGLSDRLLVMCPKDPGIIQTAGGDVDGSTDSTGTKPTLQMILSGIKNYHQVQKVAYTFREDGRKEFNSCLAELDLWQQRYTNDERRRGTIAKTPGQLARLSATLTALNNGIEMSSSGGTSHVLPSSLMTADVVKSAHQILVHLVQQKMALLPDTEGLTEDSEWDDYRVEVNDSFIDSHRVFNIPAAGPQSTEHIGNTRLSNDNTPSVRRARSSLKQNLGRNKTMSDERYAQFSNACDRYANIPVSTSFESDGGSTVYCGQGLSKRHHVPGVHEVVVQKKQCQETVHSNQSDMKLPLEEKSVSLEAFCSQNSSAEVMILTEDNEIASVPDTRKRRNVSNDRKIIMSDNNSTEMDEVSQSPKSETPSVSEDAASGSAPHSQAMTVQDCQDQKGLVTYEQLSNGGSIDRSLFLHGVFQIKTPAKDISELSDDELVDYCARKMRKLLLLPGMVVGAATICQKRLFPPVPKEMRLEHPRTTHPVWAAIEYLKRLTKLDLGELVHPIYRFQSIYFRKIRLEYMTPRAKGYLKKLFVTDEEYEQSYPKFDDSYCSSFTLVEDDITINKTPGKCLTYIYNVTE
ncbi:uncharacterized protein LOC121392138 [Gigantopelta aegis]|uniref:uncharacterized protein LOC121392138 n=1 Tax=Gigantopelta aegis TaxID=1735272 RepID=UPI001B888A71|nr:uncharacterized protein LOC121392138 [Gigantopelta aegis]